MKTLSFVIPVYNEEKRLQKTFKALAELKLPTGLKLQEIIFVDDGSIDYTRTKLLKFMGQNAKHNKIKLVSYDENKGKGFAIKSGMQESISDYTLFFDADISTPLAELTKFKPFMDQGIDVIVGTRKNGHSTVLKHQPLYRELLGRGFTKLAKTILQLSVTDFTCGFKAFSRKSKDAIFSKTTVNRWAYDAEVLYLSQKLGFSSAEKAVVWSNDENTKVSLLSTIPVTLFDLVKIVWNHELKGIVLTTPNKVRYNYNLYRERLASLL